MALKLLSRIPINKLFYCPRDRGKALDDLSQALAPAVAPTKTAPAPVAAPPVLNESPRSITVGIEETITYQQREIGKELLPLEKHSQQLCRIGGVACDCCEKHPITIEALAQETLGMTNDPVLNEIVQWAKEIAALTTEAASSSGQYDNQCPSMAVKARDLRKCLMGTVNIESLLSPDLTERVNNKVNKIIGDAVK